MGAMGCPEKVGRASSADLGEGVYEAQERLDHETHERGERRESERPHSRDHSLLRFSPLSCPSWSKSSPAANPWTAKPTKAAKGAKLSGHTPAYTPFRAFRPFRDLGGPNPAITRPATYDGNRGLGTPEGLLSLPSRVRCGGIGSLPGGPAPLRMPDAGSPGGVTRAGRTRMRRIRGDEWRGC